MPTAPEASAPESQPPPQPSCSPEIQKTLSSEGAEAVRTSTTPQTNSTEVMPSSIDEKKTDLGTPQLPQLPQLPYSLRQHKLSVTIIWTLLALDAAVIPLVLYFVLLFDTDIEEWVLFVITSSLFGIVSGVEWIFRSWRLWRRKSVRPLEDLYQEPAGEDETQLANEESELTLRESDKPGRWRFDFFHWSYTVGYGFGLVSSCPSVDAESV